MRDRTSASQAWGSTPFIFAVTMRRYMSAARRPPRSDPQNSHDFRPSATPRSPRSAALFDTHTRPSSRNSVKAGQRLSMYWIALARSCPRDSLGARGRLSAPDRQALFGGSCRSKAPLVGGQRARFSQILEAGPDREKDGVVRWRRIDLKRVIAERFGVNFHPRYVGKL
jgi:hypothetical protein